MVTRIGERGTTLAVTNNRRTLRRTTLYEFYSREIWENKFRRANHNFRSVGKRDIKLGTGLRKDKIYQK
jgi:hypothetical protein